MQAAILTLAFSVVATPFTSAQALAAPAHPGLPTYQQRCVICHGTEGQGATNVFPPLAKSDFLVKQRERTIRALCEGLSGRIRVNDVDFEGAMPAQALDNQAAADVLNYVGTSWGNAVAPFSAEEIGKVRGKTKFPTFEKLTAASAYQPLPTPPSGYIVREVVQLPEGEFGTRLAGDGKSPIVYLLTQIGNVWRLNMETGGLEKKVISQTDYLDPKRGSLQAVGITLGPDHALWISTNQEIKRKDDYPLNETAIHRTPPIGADGNVSPPKAWFTHSYPHGGGFTHGISHLGFGPDGMLYVSSGSRTDGGEKPPNHPLSPAGEVPTTACLWKFDPKAAEPKMETLAHGLRNPYGFTWDSRGRMFTVSNGPDANAPEEMDFIEPGKHYGFPYQFSDWPVAPGKPYPHTPVPPVGLTFTLPIKNLGPAGGGSAKGLSTLDPHSCPCGIIWCGDDFPAPLGGGFLVSRFGNLLGADRTGLDDSGFDVLAMHLTRAEDGTWTAKTETVLAPLGRPIDVLQIGPGRVLILEHTRPTDFKRGLSWLSGRVIELRKK